MAYQQNEKIKKHVDGEMGRRETRTRSRFSEGGKGRFLSAGLRTMNSWTDTSTDPVGSLKEIRTRGAKEGGRVREVKHTLRLEWFGLDLTRP